jgi:hypothetical protein
MSKVVPLTKTYASIQAMLAGMMVNNKCKRGFVIAFDEEGTMSVGQVESRRSEVGMALMWFMSAACRMMGDPDE